MQILLWLALVSACHYGLWTFYLPRRARWGLAEKALYWIVGAGAAAAISATAARAWFNSFT